MIQEAITRFGAMTQVELAETTGLSTATVSTLVRQLVDERRLETQNTIRNGRRATLVAPARKDGLLVGVHIGERELLIDVIDYSKTILASHRLPLAFSHKADTTIERAIILINETVHSIGASPNEIKGVGLTVAAPVDSIRHVIAVPGILPGWDGIDLAGPFGTALQVPVVVDNDANAGAICEFRMGATVGKGNFIYVDASSGVGAGIMVNGSLMRGVTGLAGEIGHIQVDPLGSICACGNRGCLNTVVGEERLISLLSVTHGNMTLEDLVGSALAGDPGCRRVISDAAVRIGTVTADLCISVDPELVVVGGRLATAGDMFLDPLAEALQRLLFPNALTPIQVVSSQYPLDAPALGAALLVMDREDRPPA